MSVAKDLKSDNSHSDSNHFRVCSEDLTQNQNPDRTISTRETTSAEAGCPNCVVRVLSRQRHGDRPCPIIDDFFAGDNELPEPLL